MNAASLLAKIRGESSPNAGLSAGLAALLSEASHNAKRLKTASSQVAKFRQAHQVWKAACKELTKQDPNAFPSEIEDLLPEMLRDISPELYLTCAQHNAFLGFRAPSARTN